LFNKIKQIVQIEASFVGDVLMKSLSWCKHNQHPKSTSSSCYFIILVLYATNFSPISVCSV